MTNANSPVFDTIIIGSGISGLAAARHLHAKGQHVCLLDKGRRIGGRLSTRRQEAVIFNHGAQFFTAKDPEFKAILEEAQTQGAVSLWEFGHHSPAYIGTPTMRDFASYLAADLDVRQSVKILSITKKDALYQLKDEAAQAYWARQIVLTIPAPQAADLLQNCDPILAKTAHSAAYDPCWTVMLALEGDHKNLSDLPARDLGEIGWASYEPARPLSHNAPAITLQASPHASRMMLDWPADDVIHHLQQRFETERALTLSVRFATAHRWLYARVRTTAAPHLPFISADHTLALAGDYFGTARIESAYISGRRAALGLLGGAQ